MMYRIVAMGLSVICWAMCWWQGTPLSIEEIFEIITPEWVRNLRDEKPYNMQFLLRKIIEKLEEVSVLSIEW